MADDRKLLQIVRVRPEHYVNPDSLLAGLLPVTATREGRHLGVDCTADPNLPTEQALFVLGKFLFTHYRKFEPPEPFQSDE